LNKEPGVKFPVNLNHITAFNQLTTRGRVLL